MSAETTTLLAFRNRDGSLGFALSHDPLTYGIRIERGGSETRWVTQEATLEWMALAPSLEAAVEACDRLNGMEAEEAESEMRRVALPSEVVETARVLIWAHVWEDGGEVAEEADRDKLSEAIAEALSGGEWFAAGGPTADGEEEARECRWPQRLLIFDLDGTLADTSAFDGPVRRSHGGELEMIRLYGGEGNLGMHDLPGIAAPGRRVVVVTSSPNDYARDVLAHIGVKVDETHPASTADKREAMKRAMREAGCGPDETLVFGDRWPDWRAAAALGITSAGVRTFGANDPAQAPDVSFRSVEELLAAPDPAELRYIGEEDSPGERIPHEGNVLVVAPRSWALGRYFKRQTREELGVASQLSRDIVAAKSGTTSPRLTKAIEIVMGRMAASERMDVGAVVSMPPKPGQVDRFKGTREMAGRLLGLGKGVFGGIEDRFPERGSQKGKSFKERQEAQRDRYRWRGESLEGIEVLLLDDVWTSGASVKAVGSALRDAGAREVHTLVWGVTQKWY